MFKKYDVIVVGAGHAGCEAAAAAANMGSSVLLVTLDMAKMAAMSCNPAMGGIAKGQILREIDALGGLSALVTDASMIQFKMLNKSKGPAMWSPRAQCDRTKFSMIWRNYLEQIQNLDFLQDNVIKLIIEDNIVKGIVTETGMQIYSTMVILTNGTFLKGLMHIGQVKIEGGRSADRASVGISDQLLLLGLPVGRMKTGTPVRIDSRSIDFSKLIEQKGDEQAGYFSYLNSSDTKNYIERTCYITYTNTNVHQVLNKGFNDSPLFDGTIQGVGPRYCPSIESKVVTFADKEKHQLFLEPEGETTIEYYLNGFSSSLPWEIQLEAMHLIPGLENAKIFRPGYAIEYDYCDPTCLNSSLETKQIENLFFAGQINGTTGYEEAAAQGLMAGINATLKIRGEKPLILTRDQAYIGVLIDDLVTKGVDEPYRMFTSRAEYRILLRQDNADARLTPVGYHIGLVDENRYKHFDEKSKYIKLVLDYCNNTSIEPDVYNPKLQQLETSLLKQKVKLKDIILRPQISIKDILEFEPELLNILKQTVVNQTEIIEAIEIAIKYEGYINREKDIADKIKRLENIVIQNKFDYDTLNSISTEARQKLKKINPHTIAQASRIPGVSPADINVLLVYLGR
jgi:tRNA uridine 5-carboxymethylaminomethyl modification enzyme